MRHQHSDSQNALGAKLFNQWTKVADVSFSNQRIHQPNKSPTPIQTSTNPERNSKSPINRLRDAVKVQVNGKTLLLDSPREVQPKDRTFIQEDKYSATIFGQQKNRVKKDPPYALITDKSLKNSSYSDTNKFSPSRSTTAGVDSQPASSTTKIYKILPEIKISQSKPPTPIQKDWRPDNSPNRSEGFSLSKNEKGNIDASHYENFEWGSEILSVETPRNILETVEEDPRFALKPPKQQLQNTKEKALGTTARFNKVAETIGFWKKEAENSKVLKEKFGMKKENDLIGLKKLLLSMDSTQTSIIKNSPQMKPADLATESDSDSDDSDDSDEPKESVLPLPNSYTYQKPNINNNLQNKEAQQQQQKAHVYTYNPFISRENSDSTIIEGTGAMKPLELLKDSANTSLIGMDLKTPKSDAALGNLSRSRRASRLSFHGKNPNIVGRSRINTKSSAGGLGGQKKMIPENAKLLILIKTWIIIKRALKRRYLRNRTEVYKYDPKDDVPVVKVIKRNKELIRRRNRHNQEDEWFQEKNQLKLMEDSPVEPFDFTGYFSLFSVKIGLKLPAGANHPGLGKIVKAGVVNKVTNKAKICHQRFLILRSFNLYWYTTPYAVKPQGVIPLPTIPTKEIFIPMVSSRCITIQQVKGRDLVLVNDGDWKYVLANEMAFKRYMEFVFEHQKKVNISLVEYFEDEDCKVLNLSQDNLSDVILQKFIYDSLHSHSKIKELNLAKSHVKGKQLEELFANLSTLKKSTRIEVLNLDSNGITQESMDIIATYLQTEVSFSLKKLTLSNNPIGDEGVQKLLEGLLTRFEKMNSDMKKKTVVLPLIELDLSNTRMGDQSIFTLITVFEQINKRLGDKNIDDHKDLLQLKMADNMISDNGMRALSKALTTFYGLKELDLSNNVRLTGAAFDYLMTHMKKSKSLAEINYNKNAIDIKGLENLFANLAENFLLKRLKVSITIKQVAAFLNSKDVIMDFYKIVPEKRENNNITGK